MVGKVFVNVYVCMFVCLFVCFLGSGERGEKLQNTILIDVGHSKVFESSKTFRNGPPDKF